MYSISSSDKIKRCPCCGNQYPTVIRDNNTVYVQCEHCGFKTKEYYYTDEQRAIDEWNNSVSPWHTGTPTESGEYLVCIRYDFGKEGYTTANYVEPYNPHTGWYNLKPPSVEDGHEWCKKNGIEVIAWQKIEPFKED